MGYRSEVVLAISKDVMPYFLNILAKEPEARSLIFKEHDTLNEDYGGEGTLLVAWSDIKWYESYEPIKAINSFVEECEADMIDGFEVEYQGDHVRFIRIGEEDNDYESRGTLHGWDITMNRSLSY